MVFLEFLGIIFTLFVITQVVLPMIFPVNFGYFWLFRSEDHPEMANPGNGKFAKPDLDRTIEEVARKKYELNKDIEVVAEKTEEELKKAIQLSEKVIQLKD